MEETLVMDEIDYKYIILEEKQGFAT